MSKVCINCGNELKDSAKFCGKCGAKVEEITSAKQVQTKVLYAQIAKIIYAAEPYIVIFVDVELINIQKK